MSIILSILRKFKSTGVEEEMSFIDHLEVLRWHIIRSVLAIVSCAILFFIFIDDIFDKVIMGPTRNDFISYRAFCKLSHVLGMGDSLCMPPMKLNLQVTSVSGTFMSSITIAFVGGLLVSLPYVFFEIWKFKSLFVRMYLLKIKSSFICLSNNSLFSSSLNFISFW